MKTWIMALPLVCVVSVAMAQGGDNGKGAGNAGATVPAPQLAVSKRTQTAPKPRAAPRRKALRGVRSLPKGDVRHCLGLKTQAGVIRCSERGRSRNK